MLTGRELFDSLIEALRFENDDWIQSKADGDPFEPGKGTEVGDAHTFDIDIDAAEVVTLVIHGDMTPAFAANLTRVGLTVQQQEAGITTCSFPAETLDALWEVEWEDEEK